MIRRLMRRFRARADETLYVGDMDTDREAARDAGCRFLWAHEFFGPEAAGEHAGSSPGGGGGRAAGETQAGANGGSR